VASEGGFGLRLEALEAGGSIVRVEGELDLATVPELEQLLPRVDPSQRLVFDLSGCTFLDSSALRVLISTIRTAGEQGGTVELVATEPGVARVLQIASVDTMVVVHRSLDAAL
jgi:anti-anti-sigma factor